MDSPAADAFVSPADDNDVSTLLTMVRPSWDTSRSVVRFNTDAATTAAFCKNIADT